MVVVVAAKAAAVVAAAEAVAEEMTMARKRVNSAVAVAAVAVAAALAAGGGAQVNVPRGALQRAATAAGHRTGNCRGTYRAGPHLVAAALRSKISLGAGYVRVNS